MWVSASFLWERSQSPILCSTLSYAQALQMTDSFRDVWIYLKLKNLSKLVFVYNYSWHCIYSRKLKERKVQYFLQSHAWELCGTICHVFHLPYKYFFLLHQCQLAAFILQRQIEMWFAFLELEGLPIMTNIMLVWARVWASRHLCAIKVFSFRLR